MSDPKAHFWVEVVSLMLAAVSSQLLFGLVCLCGEGGRHRVAPDCSEGFVFFLWLPSEKPLLAREGLQWWGLELHSDCSLFSWLSTPLNVWINHNEILISATFCLTCVHHKNKITFQTKRYLSLTFWKGALFTGKLSKEVSQDFFLFSHFVCLFGAVFTGTFCVSPLIHSEFICPFSLSSLTFSVHLGEGGSLMAIPHFFCCFGAARIRQIAFVFLKHTKY